MFVVSATRTAQSAMTENRGTGTSLVKAVGEGFAQRGGIFLQRPAHSGHLLPLVLLRLSGATTVVLVHVFQCIQSLRLRWKARRDSGHNTPLHLITGAVRTNLAAIKTLVCLDAISQQGPGVPVGGQRPGHGDSRPARLLGTTWN